MRLLLCVLIAAIPMSTLAGEAGKDIDVTFENYNQAETARNFNNWVQLGSGNKLVHRKELSPTGPDAPTIRMNLDTLYSIGVFNNDGEMSVTIPDSGIYQAVQIMDTDGYTPFYYTEPGIYEIKHDSEFLFFAFRTVVKDRHDKASFEEALAAQQGLKVEGNGANPYVMPSYDQEQIHALTSDYNKKILESGISYVYGDGETPVNEEYRTWSNAAGWGGMRVEVDVSNTYNSSEVIAGNVPMQVTFKDPGNKYFTSFTIYDTDGYLMEGNTHINSYTWKPNADGSITVHFNAEGEINNITSGGKKFNYLVRNYGVSQAALDKTINPVIPQPVK
jgi:hypothetical protein